MAIFMKRAAIAGVALSLYACGGGAPPPVHDAKADAEYSQRLKQRNDLVAEFKAAPADYRKRCEIQAGDCRLDVNDGRDKVLRTWLAGVNPLVDFAMSDAGELTFANAAVQARVATDARDYRVQWARLDNATGSSSPAGDAVTSTTARVRMPEALASEPFVEARVSATHPEHGG